MFKSGKLSFGAWMLLLVAWMLLLVGCGGSDIKDTPLEVSFSVSPGESFYQYTKLDTGKMSFSDTKYSNITDM